jgi:hypothetical protein
MRTIPPPAPTADSFGGAVRGSTTMVWLSRRHRDESDASGLCVSWAMVCRKVVKLALWGVGEANT